jgi:acetyl esterase/lipase
MIRFSIALATLLLMCCSSVTALAQSSPANAANIPAPTVMEDRDIPYVDGGVEAQRLDFYHVAPTSSPAPAARASKRPPLIIWLHGGGWMMGSKSSCPAAMIVAAGYDVAAVEYRFCTAAKFPAQIQDCQAAVRWLRAHHEQYGFDPDHIGVMGESAGGHLAALLGTAGGLHKFDPLGANRDVSDSVQAVCDCYGPSDFTTIVRQIGADKTVHNIFTWTAGSDDSNDLYKLLTGNRVGVDPQMDALASPVTYINSHDPPFLIIHGTRDSLVPVAQSIELADQLKKAGDSAVLQIIAGAGHGGRPFYDPRVLQLIKRFFNHTLKGADVPVEPIDALSKP